MPESAEVKLTVDFLNYAIVNKHIIDWNFISGKYSKDKPLGYSEFYGVLPLLVEKAECKGKVIYITCSNKSKKFYIIHNMGLSACWRDVEDVFSRWYIELDNNEKVWFHDSRTFSTIRFTSSESDVLQCLQKLGPDILTDELSLKRWKELLQIYKNKNITSFLMNQTIISGCGNYIKSECLYYAKISPLRKVSSLSEVEVEKLYEAVRIIPRCAYMNKRLKSCDEYISSEEIREIENFEMQVYGKKHCKRTKTPDGFITYWDDKVQS